VGRESANYLGGNAKSRIRPLAIVLLIHVF